MIMITLNFVTKTFIPQQNSYSIWSVHKVNVNLIKPNNEIPIEYY
jgi:hypothetical protein